MKDRKFDYAYFTPDDDFETMQKISRSSRGEPSRKRHPRSLRDRAVKNYLNNRDEFLKIQRLCELVQVYEGIIRANALTFRTEYNGIPGSSESLLTQLRTAS